MHPRKQFYSKELFNLVDRSCKKMVQDDEELSITAVLNISDKDAQSILEKILIALPERYFYNQKPLQIYDMLGYICKNFILFQVQEDLKEEEYAHHLIDFIHHLSSNIAMKYQ